jgi:hypothetical protein
MIILVKEEISMVMVVLVEAMVVVGKEAVGMTIIDLVMKEKKLVAIEARLVWQLQ